MTEMVSAIMMIGGIMLIAFVCASLSHHQFSGRIFLAVTSISIAIFCWLPVLPSWFIIFSIVAIAGMMITGGAESE